MAPDNSAITRGLKEVVQRAYNGPDRDQLSVNYARREAEASLGLEAGFLGSQDWKAKSKQIIMDALVCHSTISGEASYVNLVFARKNLRLVTRNLHHLRALVLQEDRNPLRKKAIPQAVKYQNRHCRLLGLHLGPTI